MLASDYSLYSRMVSLALFTAIFLLDSVAFALDGICAQSYSIEACHEQVVREIYATILNPLASLAAPKPKQWAENVKGRISPIGTYDGYEDTKEYFYGLPCKLQSHGAAATLTLRSRREVHETYPHFSSSVQISSSSDSHHSTTSRLFHLPNFYGETRVLVC